MQHTIRTTICFLLAASASACIGFERQSTVAGPSAVGIGALRGHWSSTNIIPSPSSCTNFKWNVSEQTSTSAKGAFSATCTGDLTLAGTAQGTLNGSVISWSAEGTGSAPGLTSCAIALTGTAEIAVDSVRVPYNGTTCLGTVSGTEVLRRN